MSAYYKNSKRKIWFSMVSQKEKNIKRINVPEIYLSIYIHWHMHWRRNAVSKYICMEKYVIFWCSQGSHTIKLFLMYIYIYIYILYIMYYIYIYILYIMYYIYIYISIWKPFNDVLDKHMYFVRYFAFFTEALAV